MRRHGTSRVIAALAIIVIIAGLGVFFVTRGDTAKLSETASLGASPTLPEPTRSLVPTVNIAYAEGWPEGGKPTPASGLEVNAFATGLDHPRWIYVLPNGDVLVAESNAPADRPEEGKGIKGKVFRKVQSLAGAGAPSADRITLLHQNGNGAATKSVFLQGLHSPIGMALVGNDLYVANTDAIMRFPCMEGATQITEPGVKVADLPGGPINHHWVKNVIASRDGTRLLATVGSNSNAAENGLDKEENRAAILEIDPASGKSRVFASGLRNPNGLGFEPQTGALWTVVNERDELGSDLVPDYLTSVKEGAFYGWPFSYWGQHVDARVPADPQMVAKAIAPDYALGNHVAPLGLAFYQGSLLPQQFRGGVFIGEHGSWNRKPRSGYKVVFVPFAEGRPAGLPVDILTGFVQGDTALGRPVGVAVDKQGALLVADDVGNTVWRVTPSAKSADLQKPR
ncbi:MAG TPA: sorbosone dehydrogenase family protein [Xanthobacteraceae bacterium]